MIDLRSDTVTKPTPQMREAMMRAEVGDDVMGEDPSINRLQEMIAEMTGMEASLFVASGTMGNQVCIAAHTERGDEIIVERNAHIFNYECGSPGMLSGVQVMPLQGKRGSFMLQQVREVVRPVNIHHPRTRLICLENTHNRASGAVFPFDEMKSISEFARENSIRMHLDGARLWNASVATGIPIREYCRNFDSVSLCFSKGLGAPVGSIVAGNRQFIEKARYFRKAFGGGMRQAGFLAAAAIYAVENNFGRMAEDHRRARWLAEFIATLPGIEIDLETVQTNIVIFDVRATRYTGRQVRDMLSEKGIGMNTFAGTRVRAVTHLHITDDDIEQTIAALKTIFS